MGFLFKNHIQFYDGSPSPDIEYHEYMTDTHMIVHNQWIHRNYTGGYEYFDNMDDALSFIDEYHFH